MFLSVLDLVEPTLDNLQRIAHKLAKRALKNGYDPNFYSPFARSAKRSLGINICGGKPDDVTVLLAVVKSTFV
ncbi:unnamed protein product [Rotaria socialis]|uniref:Uncharacterized protein n=1 Tax=Rotaria socialis TaxID=392032 RepID=A0A819V495_9BILA|nr:unnamed protein product [Rotaria socialis]CAF4134562.1 unnamed protein product [Rotaria socialis]CAF4283202.1 unnamed protein product [Rotaria socialis]CAF4447260.1 unnamed protein product [Rotaria socialis]CAF4508365.1 unnamed protein product [Rotaria socialis]